MHKFINTIFIAVSALSLTLFIFLPNLYKDKEPWLLDPNHKFIYITNQTISKLNTNIWLLIITDNLNNQKTKLKDLIKITNIAVLEVKTFESAKLASKFGMEKLPLAYFVKRGKYLNNGEFKEIRSVDFWRGVDIYFSIVLNYFFNLISDFLNGLVDKRRVFVGSFGGARIFSFYMIF